MAGKYFSDMITFTGNHYNCEQYVSGIQKDSSYGFESLDYAFTEEVQQPYYNYDHYIPEVCRQPYLRKY